MRTLGKKTWVIAEGYIPEYGTGKEPEFISHETACILNTSNETAEVELTIFFADKDPVGPYKVTVEAQRTKHLRFNDLKEPEPVPLGTDYACVIESSIPVVVQHTRLDSRQAENALLTTIAYSE
ncbi:sensory rhodopsin transducer [Salinimicrobium sp. WS361]|uniref:sensory rhodopsin transducer n=1 Tax=Salinimicrobium sp. WS361 TaxID=3425123 RepID=UPI003D6E16B4